jgi:uncharacterized protein YegP (UPF0339 family)
MAKFHVYPDKAGQFRWRLVARNGRIIADSGEGYTRRDDAHRAISKMRYAAAQAGVLDVVDDDRN